MRPTRLSRRRRMPPRVPARGTAGGRKTFTISLPADVTVTVTEVPMPSTSPAQHRLMEGVAHDPKFAAKAGIPQKVGRDFARADGDTSFAHGGTVEHKQLAKEARARGAHAFGTGLANGGVVSIGAAPPPTMG